MTNHPRVKWAANRRLGRSRLNVSPICLGTMQIGNLVEDDESHILLDAAFSAGLNFIDTANIYGHRDGRHARGRTEQILGDWLAVNPGRRDEICLASKLGWFVGPGPMHDGYSARHMRYALDRILQRLRTDYLDVLYLHRLESQSDLDEIWTVLSQFIQSGKVLSIATSNNAGWTLLEHLQTATKYHQFGPVVEQPRYNLLNRSCEVDLVPCAQKYGVGLVPYSPLAEGLLGTPLAGSGGRSSVEKTNELRLELQPRLQAFAELASDMTTNPAALAIAWLLHRPMVVAPIIGPRTVEQLHGTLAALDLQLTDETMQRLDEIFPAPQRAPMSYKECHLV